MKTTGSGSHLPNKMTWPKFKTQIYLQVIALLGVLFILIFNFVPMLGAVIAFKDFGMSSGISGIIKSRWVGFDNFIEFFNDFSFWQIMRNTLVISILKLIFTFPVPIIFAIALNEVRNLVVKKVVQTVSYFPYFVSWVIVSTMIFTFFNERDGFINQLIVSLGITNNPVSFITDVKFFYPMLVLSDIWKNSGWWSIIFIAAIASLDQNVYEAATVDGAGRLQKIWYITLPGIKSSIIIVLILSLGALLGGGLGGSNFEQSYLLGNILNRDVSDILQTYSLRMGLEQARFSYATAIGLFQSALSLILVFLSNYFAKKSTGVGLY